MMPSGTTVLTQCMEGQLAVGIVPLISASTVIVNSAPDASETGCPSRPNSLFSIRISKEQVIRRRNRYFNLLVRTIN
jgi:hypothetical protein